MRNGKEVRVRLAGFSPDDVATLREALQNQSAVSRVDESISLQASSVQDVLGAVLSDVTLVAQIGAEAALVAGSVAKIVAVVKQWIAKNPPKPGQSVAMDPES